MTKISMNRVTWIVIVALACFVGCSTEDEGTTGIEEADVLTAAQHDATKARELMDAGEYESAMVLARRA